MSQKSPSPQYSVFWSTLLIFAFIGISFFLLSGKYPENLWKFLFSGAVFSCVVFLFPSFYLEIDSTKTRLHNICRISALAIFTALTVFALTTQNFSKEYFEENIIFTIRFVMIFVYSVISMFVSKIVKKVDDEMKEEEVLPD